MLNPATTESRQLLAKAELSLKNARIAVFKANNECTYVHFDSRKFLPILFYLAVKDHSYVRVLMINTTLQYTFLTLPQIPPWMALNNLLAASLVLHAVYFTDHVGFFLMGLVLAIATGCFKSFASLREKLLSRTPWDDALLTYLAGFLLKKCLGFDVAPIGAFFIKCAIAWSGARSSIPTLNSGLSELERNIAELRDTYQIADEEQPEISLEETATMHEKARHFFRKNTVRFLDLLVYCAVFTLHLQSLVPGVSMQFAMMTVASVLFIVDPVWKKLAPYQWPTLFKVSRDLETYRNCTELNDCVTRLEDFAVRPSEIDPNFHERFAQIKRGIGS